MTKQQILDLYGQSVYQIRLSVAMHLYCTAKNSEKALSEADQFVKALQEESRQELLDRYE